METMTRTVLRRLGAEVVRGIVDAAVGLLVFGLAFWVVWLVTGQLHLWTAVGAMLATCFMTGYSRGSGSDQPERDVALDRECVKTVLRWRLKGPLDAYYDGWRSDEMADRSREALLDQAADEALQMLHLDAAGRP